MMIGSSTTLGIEEELMRRLSPLGCGLSAGIVIGLWHFAWAALVASGYAQPLLDFVLRLHFLEFKYALAPFAVSTAAMLVALTFAVGFLFGLVFAVVWNWLAAPQPGVAASAGMRASRQA